MKNIDTLITDGAEITLGTIYPIKCATTAADGRSGVAMLVRREGETLNALLNRLDKAIGRHFDNDEFVDEINGAQRVACRQDGIALVVHSCMSHSTPIVSAVVERGNRWRRVSRSGSGQSQGRGERPAVGHARSPLAFQ